MIYATEASDRIRAVIADMRGRYQKGQWESICANEVNSIWLTDCQSLHDYLINPTAQGSEDKRLEIDLESLRESLWEFPDGRLKDDIRDDQTDKPRWIDTSVMLCDPLTKDGSSTFHSRLRTAMSTGIMDLNPTVESQMKKLQQQKHRLARIQSLDRASSPPRSE